MKSRQTRQLTQVCFDKFRLVAKLSGVLEPSNCRAVSSTSLIKSCCRAIPRNSGSKP